ncbi:hypothetical protein RKD30_000497 [Streptomyces pristinaespiralis]|uniref:Uncharacterized protein n=1 Tax=Streptomyces pristinaespiralis TaxID=38300 RepID=A0A0M3QKP9_STRPR|nr:hypothetical protein SPRI_6837 [Streptomyces pristinaespiralis]
MFPLPEPIGALAGPMGLGHLAGPRPSPCCRTH